MIIASCQGFIRPPPNIPPVRACQHRSARLCCVPGVAVMGQNPIAVLRMICHGRPVFLLCVQRVRVFDGHRLILTQYIPVCRVRLTVYKISSAYWLAHSSHSQTLRPSSGTKYPALFWSSVLQTSQHPFSTILISMVSSPLVWLNFTALVRVQDRGNG